MCIGADATVADTPAAARRGEVSAPPLELAQRLSGTVEVLLLWHAETGLVELTLRDLATEASFRLEVAPEKANDAFYHPYAYMGAKADAGAEVLL